MPLDLAKSIKGLYIIQNMKSVGALSRGVTLESISQGAWLALRADQGKFIVSGRNNRVCPVERAGSLDNRMRRWVQNPQKILRPYIAEGMTVLDIGCGPGFFSIDMAQMVGKSGRVIASDLQAGMLQKLRNKIRGTELEERLKLHQCGENKIGVSERFDFVLVFYMLHEVPNQEEFIHEIGSILKPNGQVLIVEPPFHVSKPAFEQMIRQARNAGFTLVERPKVFLSKAAVLKKGEHGI